MPLSNTILEKMIQPHQGTFSAELAQYVLSLGLPQEIHEQCRELAEKAQEGTLSEEEAYDLDTFLTADAFLTILKSKARMSLKQHGSAA